MASFNKITIVGYLGRDPELRHTPSGTPVCDFSVATTERKRGSGAEAEESTTWFRATAWGRTAEVASQYLERGKLVYVEGRLSQKEWTDRDGAKRTSLEVQVTDLQFLGRTGDTQPAGRAARAGTPGSSAGDDATIADDDIPF